MAELGLKMVGKDPSGNARAINTDDLGNLKLKETKSLREVDLTFADKTGVSTVGNPHIYYRRKRSSLDAPSSPLQSSEGEAANNDYINISYEDGAVTSLMAGSSTDGGKFAQQVYVFDILESLQRMPEFAHVKNKSDILSVLDGISYKLKGYGYGDNNGPRGYGLRMMVYREDQGFVKASDHTFQSVRNIDLIVSTSSAANHITNDGKLVLMATSTYPTGMNYPNSGEQSAVYIDFVRIRLQLKNGKSHALKTDTPIHPSGRGGHLSIEDSATTTEKNYVFNVDHIVAISNDGANDLIVNFDTDTSQGNKMTLKSGEVLNNVPVRCRVLYVKSGTGSVPFRAWGVK